MGVLFGRVGVVSYCLVKVGLFRTAELSASARLYETSCVESSVKRLVLLLWKIPRSLFTVISTALKLTWLVICHKTLLRNRGRNERRVTKPSLFTKWTVLKIPPSAQYDQSDVVTASGIAEIWHIWESRLLSWHWRVCSVSPDSAINRFYVVDVKCVVN